MSASAPLLELRDVHKSYPGPEPVPVLKGASLALARGESVAIVGPSGCGKSTILNLLGTLDLPDRGTITLDGRDLTKLSAKELAALRNRQIGFIFQSHHLLPQCSVLENVLLPTLADAARTTSDAEQRARKLLDRVSLGHRLDHLPGKLSGGERQRAAVVRALINQPALLLADEPTGALDRASATNLGQLLVELNREEGVTLVVVTHSAELAQRMGRTVELLDGKLV
jgi:lipoprotein-releasing system ATP-binding protein